MEDQAHPNYVPDDPVIKSWKVFYNPHPSDERKLFLLHYLLRKKKDPFGTWKAGQEILEFRLKPNSGHAELDFSFDTSVGYDKDRGARYGTAMANSELLRSGGNYGLSGGFTAQNPRSGNRVSKDEFPSLNAVSTAQTSHSQPGSHSPLFNKQTVGGQILMEDSFSPTHMLGTFEADGLHLTPIDAIIQMTPQLHQVDAEIDQEKASRRVLRDVGEPREPAEARAVQTTVKSAEGDDFDLEDVKKLFAKTQQEEWTRMVYVDEEAPISRDTSRRFLKLPNSASSANLQAAQAKEQYMTTIERSSRLPNENIWGWGFEEGQRPAPTETIQQAETQSTKAGAQKTPKPAKATPKPKTTRRKSKPTPGQAEDVVMKD